MGQVLSAVDEAVAALAAGGIVVLPTETVYGLAARADADGVAKIFDVKQRPRDKSLQLMIPDASWLGRFARASERARVLADAFWPGPLTLVVEASEDAPPAVVSDATIGLRQPNHPLTLAVLERIGPLAASSANLSGEPTPETIDEIRELFGDRVDAYVDGGRVGGEPSTVVSLVDDDVDILRSGALSDDTVKSVLGGTGE